MNSQLRKTTRNRVQFPSDSAAVKTLWLMICNIENRRPARRAKEGAKASASAKQPIEGSKTSNWKQAINQLSVAYPNRFAAYL
ncbi:hypothetical protein HMPREF0308_0193 [Corynebacterium striatum ATCC 6940]|nr:hypothetical protein HMPREF0308_0193 [Corynebacterium striatum ATCC 6940]